MLIDADVTIAYKCSSCGSFKFFNISLFKLLNKNEYSFTCECNRSQIHVIAKWDGSCKLIIPCIGCGSRHEFSLKRKNLVRDKIFNFTCPLTGIIQCFIGKDGMVRKRVDELEKELDRLIDTFGYESYFKNTQVMLDSLNKIHDIAESGNLFCECGNNDIELLLLSDRIHLRCKSCFSTRTINATSNEDLKEIFAENQILLKSNIVRKM